MLYTQHMLSYPRLAVLLCYVIDSDIKRMMNVQVARHAASAALDSSASIQQA